MIVSLALGAGLTFAVPPVLNSIWSYLRDENLRVPAPFSWTVDILNLPAVIYCGFFKLPESSPREDENCWAIAFMFNIPYYATVIFIIWSLAGAATNSVRKRMAKDQIRAQM
jgi:hypothetical protein